MQVKEIKKAATVESEKFPPKRLNLSKEVLPYPESNLKFFHHVCVLFSDEICNDGLFREERLELAQETVH